MLWKTALLAPALLVLVGCGTAVPGGVEPSVEPTIHGVAKDEADLHLWVSNQSFEDPTVVITITIDGVEIASQPFEVANQHNWQLFPIAAPPGPHVLEARSDRGITMRQEFTLPEEGRRYAVVDHWSHPDEHFTWHIESTPIGFD